MAQEQNVSASIQPPRSVNELLKQGKAAYEAGDKLTAHNIWREAAQIDPYDERVWIALSRVVESTEDRRVCLENVLAINPYNASARQQLAVYQREIERSEQEAARYAERLREKRRAHRRTFFKGVAYGIISGLAGILIAVLFGAVLYGAGYF